MDCQLNGEKGPPLIGAEDFGNHQIYVVQFKFDCGIRYDINLKIVFCQVSPSMRYYIINCSHDYSSILDQQKVS